MDRREFIKKSIAAGLTAGAAISTGSIAKLFGKTPGTAAYTAGNYDLVAVKNGEPDVMFNKAMQAMGGIGKYVKSG